MINTIKEKLGFKIDYLNPKQIRQLNKIAYYKPKLKIGVVIIAISIMLISLITPFTNWLLIPIALKIWVYR